MNKRITISQDDRRCYRVRDAERQTLDNMYFIWESVKWYDGWYDGYAEVDQLNKFVTDNSDECCLLRVGEDLGDAEELGSCYNFDLYVQQAIVTPDFLPDTNASNTLFGE